MVRQSMFLGAACFVIAAHGAHAQTKGGILRTSIEEVPTNASIHEVSTRTTLVPFMPVFNNLVMFNPAKPHNAIDDIVGDLATEWSWSPDRTVLTMKLQPGVTWHDDKPFSSEDVKCTWDTLAGKREAGWRANPRSDLYVNLKEVTTNGPGEVSFVLDRPQPSFIGFLASGLTPVYPCHVSGDKMRRAPIGTGPFKVQKIDPKLGVTLVRNEHYFKQGLPYLDGIEFKVVADRATRLLSFIAGQSDLFDGTSAELADIKTQVPDAQCLVQMYGSHAQLLINRDAKPFDNPDIRRAIGLSLDRQAFVKILTDGYGKIAGTMFPAPEGDWGLTEAQMSEAKVPGVGDVEKNREEARAIMQKAGYSASNPLKIKLITRTGQNYQKSAVLTVDHLRQVFVDAQLETLEQTKWYGALARHDYALAANVFAAPMDDPDATFYGTYTCGSERNYTNYCDKPMEARIEAQSRESDLVKRKKMVQDIDMDLQRDLVRLSIMFNVSADCQRPYIKGRTRADNSDLNWRRSELVWIDQSAKVSAKP